jgi:hypothetical protein
VYGLRSSGPDLLQYAEASYVLGVLAENLAKLIDAGAPWKRLRPDWPKRLKGVTLPSVPRSISNTRVLSCYFSQLERVFDCQHFTDLKRTTATFCISYPPAVEYASTVSLTAVSSI